MTTRTTWVPLHSIMVVRDGQQVDALAEYKRTGKAFKFTADEVKEIEAIHEGALDLALRAPTDEAADEPAAAPTPPPATSNEPAPAEKPATTPASDTGKPAGKGKAAAKDTDL